MKRALTLATGFTVGYVAGAKAGREKYEQMKDKMQQVSQQPAVAEMRENLQGQVGSATKAVAEKVNDVASGLTKKLHGSSADEGSSSSSVSSTSTTSGSTSGSTPTSTSSTTKPSSAKSAVGEYPAAPTGVVPGKGSI